ncbi:MAG: LuxR C-terminal-related transcriptional regulator [Candidatus Contendobacter sp.]|jgi:transcriptional regulator EpsA|nr:LuxR C-terminal-related transcriptional regulator [Candidatus Contendobacter sp.]
MNPPVPPADPEDRDRLIWILESATQVSLSRQFFAWSQGPLYTMLPHEILICGIAAGPERNLRLRYHSASRYFTDKHFEAACNPRNGLITRVIEQWKETRQPCLIPSPPGATPCDPQWEALLHRLELRNMAAHGQISPQGGVSAWFGFFRVRNMDARTARALELLLPCLTATYARVLSQESGMVEPDRGLAYPLSRRQIEVVEMLRDGSSNADIAERLGISVMTAKNHVQNIRAKLKVGTRGQAVVESIRLGLIRPTREEP